MRRSPKRRAKPASRLDASEQIELCYARGWTDGLPVVPATQDLVDAMLEAAGLSGDAVVAQMPSRKVAVTAEKVAINAVMAGCKPEYMPVVAAAVKALATPEFGLHHVASALSGPTIVIVVNGPIAKGSASTRRTTCSAPACARTRRSGARCGSCCSTASSTGRASRIARRWARPASTRAASPRTRTTIRGSRGTSNAASRPTTAR